MWRGVGWGGLGYHCQVARRGKGGMLQYARGSEGGEGGGGGGGGGPSRCSVMFAFIPSLHVVGERGRAHNYRARNQFCPILEDLVWIIVL